MSDLPKVNPVNIVMESEKYYDFDPSSFKNVLPTLKTVGGGIADILIPQDATDVAMMAIPPVMVYKRVKKILDRVDTLRAEAQSLFNSFNRGSRSPKDIREAQLRNNEADRMVKSISKEDKKIHDDYQKSLMGTKESNQRGADKARRILAGDNPEKKKFEQLANKGEIRQARTNKENINSIKNKEIPAQDFNIQNMSDDIAFDYEVGDFTKQFKNAGLHVIDDRMGRVIVGRTKKDAINLLNAKNPIDYGKAYGYSDADIAQFYITRRGGNVDNAYKDFTKDLLEISK
jgi:hypothetical protein